MLAGLKAAHLSTLHGLQLSNLQRIELLLAGEHLRGKELALGQLHQLWLTRVLEAAHGTNRLVDGATTGSVAGLETGLRLAELTHLLRLVIELLVVLLAPISFEISGTLSAMATLAATALKIRLTSIVGSIRWRELEGAAAGSAAASGATGS